MEGISCVELSRGVLDVSRGSWYEFSDMFQRLLRMLRPARPPLDAEGKGIVATAESPLEAVAETGNKVPLPLITSLEFDLSDELIATIKSEFEAVLDHPPSSEQYKMILSKSPNSMVNAGAGSGKSTSLVLRILVMHRYLKIPLAKMTVFSFTKASTQEFREKLIKTFAKFDLPLTKDDAKKLITTFHSKLLKFNSDGSRANLFAFAGDPAEQVKGGPVAEALLGIADSKLSIAQQRILRETYDEIYETHHSFRSRIDSLYRDSLNARRFFPDSKEYQTKTIERAARVDKEVSLAVQKSFNNWRDMVKFLPVDVGGKRYGFYANYHFPEQDAYVVFCPKYLGDRKKLTFEDLPLASHLTIKTRLLAAYCEKDVYFVRSEEEFNSLEKEMKWLSSGEASLKPPQFTFGPRGDRPAVLYESFYQSGGFIESLGLRVSDVARRAASLEGSDATFLAALGLFWEAFDLKIEALGMTRFSNMFREYSDSNTGAFDSVGHGVMRSMTHVMIDEFQDISPEVLKWIRGALAYQRNSGADTSLMCIGDDYQSIYGWRGSSPQYIAKDYYMEEFSSSTPAAILPFERNFRSDPRIIEAGERVLREGMRAEMTKFGKAKHDFDGSVSYVASESLDEIEQGVEQVLRAWKAQGEPLDLKEPPIMVLARGNRMLGKLEKRLKNVYGKYIRFQTFHRSKGLEADYCVLVGDCSYTNTSPLRNLVSNKVFGQSYDHAQHDEAMRLAYVGITRAKKKVIWFAKPHDDGAFNLARGL